MVSCRDSIFWRPSLFQVAVLLECVLMPGSPLCRGHWFLQILKVPPKKGAWVPWFCRENILLHLWQVPHSAEAWDPLNQICPHRMGTPNPPRSLFWGYENPVEIHWHGWFGGTSIFRKPPFVYTFYIYIHICIDEHPAIPAIVVWKPGHDQVLIHSHLNNCLKIWTHENT